jgi:molybdate transport system ATP-binding protein
MSSLHISQGTFRLSDTRTLTISDALTLIRAGESWAFVGTNGSGKSALARALSGRARSTLKGNTSVTLRA